MDTPSRNKLAKAILEILALLLAALLGWLAGCSARWSPSGSQVDFLWPHQAIDVTLKTTPTTRPAIEPNP